MVVKHFVAGAVAVSALGLSACSSAQSGPTPPFLVYPSPSASPSATESATPKPVPTATVTATAAPSPTPTPTPTPTPVATAPPSITGSLSSITVCAEETMTCADDLDANATSGESAAILVKGALGTLSFSNAGGPSVATVTSKVYATSGNETEYEVFYTSAVSSATTDTLTIADSGSRSSLTIPVSIIDVGADTGASAFSLTTTSGIPCPGHQMTFGTQQQGNATIVLSTSNSAALSIAQNGRGVFALSILAQGSGYVTAAAGSSTVIYPVNIPAAGFTSSC